MLWIAGPAERAPAAAQSRPRAVRRRVRRRLPLARARAAARAAIKLALMDNHLVVGVGNIYANESLFRAGIRPARPRDGSSRPRSRACRTRCAHVLARGHRQGRQHAARLRRRRAASRATSSSTISSTGAPGCPAASAGRRSEHARQGQRASFYCPALPALGLHAQRRRPACRRDAPLPPVVAIRHVQAYVVLYRSRSTVRDHRVAPAAMTNDVEQDDPCPRSRGTFRSLRRLAAAAVRRRLRAARLAARAGPRRRADRPARRSSCSSGCIRTSSSSRSSPSSRAASRSSSTRSSSPISASACCRRRRAARRCARPSSCTTRSRPPSIRLLPIETRAQGRDGRRVQELRRRVGDVSARPVVGARR